MKKEADGALKRWVNRLEAEGIKVPDDITPTSAQALIDSLAENKSKQHLAAHFALHVFSAQRCAEGNQQMGQSDPESKQAAQ